MICGCGNTGVLRTVLGKDYFYCQECKKEIMLTVVEVDKSPATDYTSHREVDGTWKDCKDNKCPFCNLQLSMEFY